jgi:hypothetical protein
MFWLRIAFQPFIARGWDFADEIMGTFGKAFGEFLFDREKTDFVITWRVDGEDGFQRDPRSKMPFRTDDGGESIVYMDALLITCLSQGPSKGEVS